MTEPTTEADLGRRNVERWLAQYGITTNDAELGGLLDGWRAAIEAEARAEGEKDADSRIGFRAVDTYNGGIAKGRADALREAAERVRAMPPSTPGPLVNGCVERAAVLAILDPEAAP